MNYILQGIPNDIYNSVDACKDAKTMWNRIKRLMQGTYISKQERHSRLINEFDKFMAAGGESLISVYERFSTLINIMDHNGVIPKEISINTKLLNSLQPEWSKFVTLTRQKYILEKEHFDVLYDYLSQFEPHVKASKAKKSIGNHDPLALIANSNAYLHILMQVHHTHVHHNHTMSLIFHQNAGRTNMNQSTNARNGMVQNIEEYDQNVQRVPRTSQLQERKMEQMLLATKDEAGVHLVEEENDFMLDNAYGGNKFEELNAAVIMTAPIQPTDDKYDVELTYDAEVISEGPRAISSRIFTFYNLNMAYTILWIRRIDLVSFVVFSEVQAHIRRIFLDGYDVLVVRTGPRAISSRIFTFYNLNAAYTILWIRRIDLVSFVVFSEVQAQIRRIFLDGYDVLVVRT
nr:hypothetical protein [Tanacetum cinerariifolium]